MSRINSIDLNGNLLAFKSFVASSKTSAEKEKTVASARLITTEGKAYKVVKSERRTASGAGDKLHFWGRTSEMKKSNNQVRLNFFNAVVEQFGGDFSRVPENVKKAMLLEDYGLDENNLDATDGAFKTGKPLLARRIDAVITEVEKALAKERGAKAFGSFYNSMKANANPSGGIETNFNGAQKILTDFTSALLEKASSLTLAKKNEMLQTCEDELSKMARQLDKFKLGEMVDRFGEFKMNKGIETCMERCLKSLRDTLVGGLKSKYDQDMLKAGFNSFIDSMKTERKLDEKIAAAFAKQYQINGKLHSVDGNLAALNMKLNELESARPKNEDEIAKTKGEIEKQTAALKVSKTRTKVIDAAIKELFNDKEFCALAAKKDFGLVTRDILADEGKFDKDVAASGKTGTLEKLEGSTSEAVAKFHAQHPNEKICVHVYGDRTFLFCGLLSDHWTTQEEAAVRDADVKTWAHLLGKGLIKPSKKVKDRFELATDKMNSIKGFTIKTRMQFTRQVPNARPISVTFLFSSMPSLTEKPHSLDADGDYDFLKDCMDLYDKTNWNVKKSELKRAKKFIKTLHDLFKGGGSKYTDRQFKTALKLLKFSGPNDYFNVFGKDSKKEVFNLLDFVANTPTSDELMAKQKAYDTALAKFTAAQDAFEKACEGEPAIDHKKRAAAKVQLSLAKDTLARFMPNEKDAAYLKAKATVKKFEESLAAIEKSVWDLPVAKAYRESELLLADAKDGLEKVQKKRQQSLNTVKGQAFEKIVETANKNYETVVRKHIREWIILARETGSGVFLGGPIGCGVFGNDRKVVAKILAEEFQKNGGAMKFVYNLFATAEGKVSEEDMAQYKIFQEAFAAVGLANRIGVGNK